MKWPERLILVRHDVSTYNALKAQKEASPIYQEFKAAYKFNPESGEATRLARVVMEEFGAKQGDHNTPLAENAIEQARRVGENLKLMKELPGVIFVSPYLRTQLTLQRMKQGWPELAGVKTVEEERIREQDHGLSILYNDWRVFNVFHPDQIKLREAQGAYWYRYPQGENVPDVRMRLRDWLGTLTRDYAGQNVLAISHHLTILSLRANLERLDAKEFLRLDQEEKPINCGVTIYQGRPNEGVDGRLVLETYNLKLW